MLLHPQTKHPWNLRSLRIGLISNQLDLLFREHDR